MSSIQNAPELEAITEISDSVTLQDSDLDKRFDAVTPFDTLNYDIDQEQSPLILHVSRKDGIQVSDGKKIRRLTWQQFSHVTVKEWGLIELEDMAGRVQIAVQFRKPVEWNRFFDKLKQFVEFEVSENDAKQPMYVVVRPDRPVKEEEMKKKSIFRKLNCFLK